MAPALPLVLPALCLLFLRSTEGQGTSLTGNVTGPDFLVTDWTRQLNLTCLVSNASVVSMYLWFTPGTDTKRCNETPVCTFQPRLEDDNQNVTCSAVDPTGGFLLRTFYQVNLTYPPPSPPFLTQTNTVQPGDVITCRVSGGKPSVTNVTFHCQHPDHADREDDVSDDGGTVSSSVTVNTSHVYNQSMLCSCSAHWDPEPGLYNETTNTEFILNSPGESEALSLGAIVGIATGACIVIVVVVAIVVICTIKKTKNKKRKPKRNKSRDYYENPELIMEDMQSRRGATADHPQAHGSQSPYAVSTVHQNKAFQIDDDGGEYDVLGIPKPKPTPGPIPIYSHLS
ncbi:uncharacterized protein [Littorina saxatilis]|uniref:uncharacterized protein isoform X2 n=1 Tax=Littorina saxatilis TaxID=31220 RepID=UPI0038B644A4